MSLSKTLKFKLKAMLYGSSSTVVVNSGTNTAVYNTYVT